MRLDVTAFSESKLVIQTLLEVLILPFKALNSLDPEDSKIPATYHRWQTNLHLQARNTFVLRKKTALSHQPTKFPNSVWWVLYTRTHTRTHIPLLHRARCPENMMQSWEQYAWLKQVSSQTFLKIMMEHNKGSNPQTIHNADLSQCWNHFCNVILNVLCLWERNVYRTRQKYLHGWLEIALKAREGAAAKRLGHEETSRETQLLSTRRYLYWPEHILKASQPVN